MAENPFADLKASFAGEVAKDEKPDVYRPGRPQAASPASAPSAIASRPASQRAPASQGAGAAIMEKVWSGVAAVKEELTVAVQTGNQFLTGQSSEKAEVMERVYAYKQHVEHYKMLYDSLADFFEKQEKKRAFLASLGEIMHEIDIEDPENLQGLKTNLGNRATKLARNQEPYVLAIKDFRSSVTVFKDAVLGDLDINVNQYIRKRKLYDAALLRKHNAEKSRFEVNAQTAQKNAEDVVKLKAAVYKCEVDIQEKLDMLNMTRKTGLSAMTDIFIRVVSSTHEQAADILAAPALVEQAEQL